MTDVERENNVEPLRLEAIEVLKKQRDFRRHLMVYLLVNAGLVAIWLSTDAHGFFWPVFPLFFWGIGVVFNAWDAYGQDALSESRIEQEMERLQRRR